MEEFRQPPLVVPAVPSPSNQMDMDTSIWDGLEVLQLSGCHHLGHAKRPLPASTQEYRPRPVRPAERRHPILVSSKGVIRCAALF